MPDQFTIADTLTQEMFDEHFNEHIKAMRELNPISFAEKMGVIDITETKADNYKKLLEHINKHEEWRAHQMPSKENKETRGDIGFSPRAIPTVNELFNVRYVPDGDRSAIAIGSMEDGTPMLYNRNDYTIIATVENDCIRLRDGAIGCRELDIEDIQVLRAFFDMVAPKKV
jgi:hypothetical protein